MATLVIDHIDAHTLTQLDEMADHAGESSPQIARFFLAASLYHAHKISFHAAATLSGSGFNEFKQRLRENFSTGYVIAPEVVEEDLRTARHLSKSL